MFPNKILAQVFGLSAQKRPASMSYEEIFKGEASAPAEAAQGTDWLPGLSPAAFDVDGYFKEVFAGQVL